MSSSTCSKKAAAKDNVERKPLSLEKAYSLINSFQSEVSFLKSPQSTDIAEIQFLCMAISHPPVVTSCYPTSVYNHFMQEPYCVADCFSPLLNDGYNYPKGLSCVNCVLCISLNSEELVDNSPSLLNNQSAVENWAISHFIDEKLSLDFALFIGIIPLRMTAKVFFKAIKGAFLPW
ncbi:hypothetical protein O181_070316 [Austropuccinia psidii MF-1]|uniref:Uncharacterized protein n=1 Tax=Austropuccinia psidii MF-1 TaxID=1389203 RepID=A0A9Q3F561_9BASI|nr:hypothetical protein [Austropuccinia psidii MF-1]